jgi:hypothetical protein
MCLLAASQADKTRAKVADQQKVVIELGMQIAARLEQQWWASYTMRADEIRVEFDRLFYRFGLEQNLQDAYKPITLLQWLRPPNFYDSRFAPPDTKITKCRRTLSILVQYYL